MRKTILIALGTAFVAAMTVQGAAASPHHGPRPHASAHEQFRNSNGYVAPAYADFSVRGLALVQHDSAFGYNDPSKFGGQTRY